MVLFLKVCYINPNNSAFLEVTTGILMCTTIVCLKCCIKPIGLWRAIKNFLRNIRMEFS